jgi:hypothetical protein
MNYDRLFEYPSCADAGTFSCLNLDSLQLLLDICQYIVPFLRPPCASCVVIVRGRVLRLLLLIRIPHEFRACYFSVCRAPPAQAERLPSQRQQQRSPGSSFQQAGSSRRHASVMWLPEFALKTWRTLYRAGKKQLQRGCRHTCSWSKVGTSTVSQQATCGAWDCCRDGRLSDLNQTPSSTLCVLECLSRRARPAADQPKNVHKLMPMHSQLRQPVSAPVAPCSHALPPALTDQPFSGLCAG